MWKTQKKLNYLYFSVIAAAIIFFSGSLGNGLFFDIKAAFGYGGGGGFTPSVPTTVTAINVPLTISGSQAGTVSQTFSDSSRVEVEVPKGAVAVQTTFNASRGSLEPGNTPMETTGAFLVGGQVFNITATDTGNNAVRSFSNSLSITLTIPGLPGDTSNLGVYYFNDTAQEWVLVPGAEFDPSTGQVSFSVDHLTQYAVFKIANAPDTISVDEKAVAEENITIDETLGGVAVVAAGEYADGVLIRGKNMRIYVIKNQSKWHIKTLADLRKYAGQEIIDVADSALAEYPDLVGKASPAAKAKAYGFTNNLGFGVWGDDVKSLQWFLIKKDIGPSARNLARVGATGYFGPLTRNALSEYQKSAGLASVDGSFNDDTRAHVNSLSGNVEKSQIVELIRTPDFKIYVVVSGVRSHVKTLSELGKYSGKTIYNIGYDELADY